MRCTASHKPVEAELACALDSVREARRLLASPSAATTQESGLHVEAAIKCLETIQRSLRSRGSVAPAGLAAKLESLRKEIFQVSASLERAAMFYFSWARLLYTAACGYTANGEPAAPGRVSRVSVEG